jgi:hypothetical protein
MILKILHLKVSQHFIHKYLFNVLINEAVAIQDFFYSRLIEELTGYITEQEVISEWKIKVNLFECRV